MAVGSRDLAQPRINYWLRVAVGIPVVLNKQIMTGDPVGLEEIF